MKKTEAPDRRGSLINSRQVSPFHFHIVTLMCPPGYVILSVCFPSPSQAKSENSSPNEQEATWSPEGEHIACNAFVDRFCCFEATDSTDEIARLPG